MNTDFHRKRCGCASIEVLSLWSENLAKLELFCVNGCGKPFFLIQKPGSHQRREYVDIYRGGRYNDDILIAIHRRYLGVRDISIAIYR